MILYRDSVQFVANKKRKLDKDKKVDQTTVRVVKNVTYVPLQDALGVDWTPEEQKKVTKLTPWYLLARGVFVLCYCCFTTIDVIGSFVWCCSATAIPGRTQEERAGRGT